MTVVTFPRRSISTRLRSEMDGDRGVLPLNETPQETSERLARDRGYKYPEWDI